MDGSNGNIVALLERIAAAQEAEAERHDATNKAIGELAAGQEQLRGDMNKAIGKVTAGQEQLRADMNGGFAAVNQRVDNLIVITGTRYLDHEQRIHVLEERVVDKE